MLGIRTNAVDEKSRACKVLSIFVDDLHASMLPWLPQIMQTILPLLNNSPFEDMKMASLAIMPELLVSFADSITTNAGVASYREQYLLIVDTLRRWSYREVLRHSKVMALFARKCMLVCRKQINALPAIFAVLFSRKTVKQTIVHTEVGVCIMRC